MVAYLIAQINVTNEESYKEYLSKVTSIVKKYDGEYIIRAGKFTTVLGEWKYNRNVVIKFPSYDIAINWYNSKEYLPIREIRENNSEGNVIIIEGV
tara:strand:+ start:925 stop:1212 length:288 start_codon:yes stop_codon:yes gene_type:complete